MINKLYKAGEWTDQSGKVRIQCDDLIGTGRNWIEPARVMNLTPAEFIVTLKNEYNATITPYRKNGKISFIGYCWESLADARRFKNILNKIAREKDYKI